jgi:hypothetical protein
VGVRRGLLLAVIVAGVCAAAARGAVIPQHGIAGVSIGMTKAKVRSVLGKPKQVIRSQNPFGSYVRYQYTNLSIDFQGGGRLSNVFTTRRRQRTPTGIGVGSTRKQVVDKVRGVNCSGNLCKVGKAVPGKIVTTFYLLKNKVVAVSVGRVLD